MSERPQIDPQPPYVGLRPFQLNEAELFYGRGEHIATMAHTLRKGHFLAVVGSSGSGKSSLVKAGLLPAIDDGFMNDRDDKLDWRFVDMRPGLDPYQNLVKALMPELTPVLAFDPGLVEFRRQTLRGGPRGLLDVVGDSLLPEAVRVVVLVDQFEEIFRFLDRGRPGQPGDVKATADQRNDALAFVDMMLATAAERDPQVYVVLTMRSEYLGECEAILGLSAAIAKGQFLTPRMTREQIQDIIERPLAACGGRVEPAVVTSLLNALGTAQDQLPRVEHLLLQMWMEKTKKVNDSSEPVVFAPDDYREVGGFEGALNKHAERLYADLGPGTVPDQPSEKQYVAEQMFRSLATRTSQGTLVRRLSSVAEVAVIAGKPEQMVFEVVKHYLQPGTNFLVASETGPDKGVMSLDISHESLLRQWSRLGKWVTAEAETATELQRLVRDAESWRKNERGFLGQPELGGFQKLRKEKVPSPAWAGRYVKVEELKLADDYLEQSLREQQKNEEANKRNRMRSVVVGILAMLLLIVVPSLIFSWIRLGNARDQQKDAEHESRDAQRLAIRADDAFREALVKLGSAEERERKANKAIEKQALQDQLIRGVRIVRALAELWAAGSDAEFAIAANRWQVLFKQVQEQEKGLGSTQPFITKCINDRYPTGPISVARTARINPAKPKEANLNSTAQRAFTGEKDWESQASQVLSVAHDLRKIFLDRKQPEEQAEVQEQLQAIRTLSYEALDLCVTGMLDSFEEHPFDDAAPYVREFWLNYYGDFGLTEGRQVASAMAQFGDVLHSIERRIPEFAFADKLDSYRYNIKERKAKAWSITDLKFSPQQFENARLISEVNEHFRKYSRLVFGSELVKLKDRAETLRGAIVTENRKDVLIDPSPKSIFSPGGK